MKRVLAWTLAICLLLSLAACGGAAESGSAGSAQEMSASEPAQEPAQEAAQEAVPAESTEPPAEEGSAVEAEPEAEPEPAYEPTEEELAERAAIEEALDLKNMDQTWTYSDSADAWVMTPVVDVVNPVLPDYQGVSVAVPGAYVFGLDTSGDGQADVFAGDSTEAVAGSLVIDYDAEITSTNGQTYRADTAPVIFTTGAAGYGSQGNGSAGTSYAGEGYISVGCGNRGKQSYVADEDGNVDYYTGDAPCCLTDQKAAARFVKYNILLGNLPGSLDYWVTTGGSGGAAHAAMYAATSNNPDFYDYQIEAGAVGVYRNGDGSYSTAVTIDGEPVELSDGVWGCVAYSAITSLYEGDMAQAFEYYLDPTFSFSTDFQAQLAEYLSAAYMEYINEQGLRVEEEAVGFDINADGDTGDVIDLTIEYDPDKYPDTNGYGGTYLDLYLLEFQENLSWYLGSLDYAEGWTWFDAEGAALSDEDVAAMTAQDRAAAFVEGRYAKGSTGFGGPGGMGGPPGGPGGPPDMMGPPPDMMGGPPDMMGGPPDMMGGPAADDSDDDVDALFGEDIRSGGPEEGSTASAASGDNSRNYSSYGEMAAAYAADVAEIEAGDQYGKNIVDLYNPIHYIGAEGTLDPTWTRVVMGAVEGDMPMMASLNMQIAWLSAGTHAQIEWQWDGGHVPNEVLGSSLALYVDEMYGEFEGGKPVEKSPAEPITANGDAESASGKDLSGWVEVTWTDGSDMPQVSFTLADVLAYRNAGAMKAVPGFDVIDFGQEDYVFGKADQDARHWDPNLAKIFQNEEYAKTLEALF